jgi:hypothetical protein
MADTVKKEKKSNLITQSAYAKLKGISRQAVNEHVSRGNITLIDGRIDPVLADRQLLSNIDPSQDSKILKNLDPERYLEEQQTILIYNKAKAKKMYFSAKLLELEYKMKTGELINLNDVKKEAFTRARRLRDRLLNIPDRVSALIAGEGDHEKVLKILQQEFKKALDSI